MPNGREKNLVRLCAAVDGFRSRYGRWPTRVRLFPEALANIRDQLLSPDGYARITSKVNLVADDATMIAEDDSEASYNYGKEGFPKNLPSPSAWECFDIRLKG